MSDNELLLGQPLHHTQALELVCAAERCDTWAEIRADGDGIIRFYTGDPECISFDWRAFGGENIEYGTGIGSLQMFGEEVDWKTWGIRQSDWRQMFPENPHNERAFREYMHMTRSWVRVVQPIPVYGEYFLVGAEKCDPESGQLLGKVELIQDGWADLLGVDDGNWRTWQMEL